MDHSLGDFAPKMGLEDWFEGVMSLNAKLVDPKGVVQIVQYGQH